MPRILFDIAAPHETTEWSDGHLVIEISHHIFSYAVINPDKKLLQLRFYELDAKGNHDMAEEMAGIIGKDDLLKKGIAKKTVIYNFPESQLVPGKYFQAGTSQDLMVLLHGDLDTGTIHNERIQGSDQYNVYKVPAEVHSLMQRSFSHSKYWHYYSLWLLADQRQSAAPADYLSVLFYPNRILVSAVKDTQLQLVQSYAYEAAEDAGYHLLNICQQLQLPPENTTVVLSGMIDAGSVLYTEIYKYFGQVILEKLPGVEMALPSTDEYPAHFFSPLLKVALCVS